MIVSAPILASVLALLPAPTAAVGAQVARELLSPRSVEGCPGLAVASHERELLIEGTTAVDLRARYWDLDRPAVFEASHGQRLYRVGSGTLRVDSRLSDDHRTETIWIRVERAIEPGHRARYLRGVELPCVRTVQYALQALPPIPARLEPLGAFDRHLQAAAELVYDERFERARAELHAARELRPEAPAPYWLLARLAILEIEADTEARAPAERVAVYEGAEAWADRAVERAPERAEGYLWRGIARGRMATAQGNLRVAFTTVLGGRGPAWIEQTLTQAAALPYDYAFFGSSTRSDALYALAQFYRLAPDGWYMRLVGTRGDRGRAVELARRAVDLAPTRIDYRLELLVSLLCRDEGGDRDEALDTLAELRRLPAVTELDAIDQRHAESLLERAPASVCGYSRDGFQEPGV